LVAGLVKKRMRETEIIDKGIIKRGAAKKKND
jgi:hypothetical protein